IRNGRVAAVAPGGKVRARVCTGAHHTRHKHARLRRRRGLAAARLGGRRVRRARYEHSRCDSRRAPYAGLRGLEVQPAGDGRHCRNARRGHGHDGYQRLATAATISDAQTHAARPRDRRRLAGSVAGTLAFAHSNSWTRRARRFSLADPGMNLLLLYLPLFKATVTSFSGLTSLPVVRHDFVEKYRVLTDRQLNAAVAAGRTAPGPNGMYIVSVGYFVAGPPGAFAGWLAVITPAFLIIPLLRFLGRRADQPRVKSAIRGVML